MVEDLGTYIELQSTHIVPNLIHCSRLNWKWAYLRMGARRGRLHCIVSGGWWVACRRKFVLIDFRLFNSRRFRGRDE